MAQNWIKVEVSTPDKPEVVKMASALGIDQDAVAGKLLRIWIWADTNSVDGHDISVTDSFLDRLTHCPGFADALRGVGWLSGRDGLLTIPNFCRHNGQSAKSRALATGRQATSRSKRDKSVTRPLPEEEEEIDNKGTHTAREGHRAPPTLEVVKETASKAGIPPDVAEKFFHEAESRPFAASGMWTDIRGNEMNKWQNALQAFWLGWQNRGVKHHHGKNRSERDRDENKTGICVNRWMNVCAVSKRSERQIPKYIWTTLSKEAAGLCLADD